MTERERELLALEHRINELRAKRHEIAEEIRQAEYEYEELATEGLPSEDGWYLDANGLIACRENGRWHDGWGNGGPDYGAYEPPMTRLVPASDDAEGTK